MYQDGTLKARLFDFLVTEEMKTRAGDEGEVELTVAIEEGEYEKACTELIDEAKGNAFTVQLLNIFKFPKTS